MSETHQQITQAVESYVKENASQLRNLNWDFFAAEL